METENKRLKATILFYQVIILVMSIVGILLFQFDVACASTIKLVPSTQYAAKGQNFTVAAFVVPDSTNYTVNARIAFSGANLVSWHTSLQWLELPVPYYWQDYTWGISRTAGFPGGFSERKYFGTLYLKATETGPINVTTEPSSIILDADNKNVYEITTKNY